MDFGNPDYVRYFYAGNGGQDQLAVDFQQEKGWKRIWGSDSQGLNGDTWVVYRSISDLPKYLRKYAEVQESLLFSGSCNERRFNL